MFGIAGMWGDTDVTLVKKMLSLVSHRGPDAEGMFVSQNGPGVLGHRRLSIMDPEGGGQLIYNMVEMLDGILTDAMERTEIKNYRRRFPETALRSGEECHYHRILMEVFEQLELVMSNVAYWAEGPSLNTVK